MRIKLTKATRVSLPADAVIDVEPEQARRIINLGRGVVEAEAVTAPKTPRKKTTKKAE